MVLFAISLYAILTRAQNISTVECSDNDDCLAYYDKFYCYDGKCTDRCPPGYTQENDGDEPFFTCKCDTDKGFKVSGYFSRNSAGVRIPKCLCRKTYCHITVYAMGIGYTDGLVPKGSPPNCKIKTDEIPPVISDFIFYMIIGTMILFTFINCRSTSGVIYDYHRYIGIYVLASIAVIVFVQTVHPFSAGFTRTMGFGVIIHNSAEWNFLLRLHFGKRAEVRNGTTMCVMLYYVLLLFAMAVLPLKILFLVAMIQGGFLDWTLFFFTLVGVKNVTKEPNWQYVCKHLCCGSVSRFAVWFGFASFFHLLTVEILFVGFALNSPFLIGIGSIFLVPTFFSYTFWAYGEDRLALLCGPGLAMDYTKPTDGSTGFSLVPFTHTTRTSDFLWQAFLGDRVVTYVTGDDAVASDGEESESAKLIKRENSAINIDDCENFKFGVSAQTIDTRCQCISWIPIYWAAAFTIVVGNATAILHIPEYKFVGIFLTKRGCPTGFEHGVW